MPLLTLELAATRPRASGRAKMRMLFDEIAQKCDLPPLPAVASRALELARNPSASVQDLVHVVSADAAIASRVLRMTASTIYGRQRTATTLQDAIVAIGHAGLRKVLIAASSRSAYRIDSAYAQRLWNHALATAIAADELSVATGEPRGGSAFIAALLHDIGRLVMHLSDPENAAGPEDDDLLHEEQHFGVAHAAVGACLAEQWGLKDEVVEAIMFHHVPELSPLARRLADADHVAHLAGFGCREHTNAAAAPVERARLASIVSRTFAAEAALFE
jgi:putative nucleotidyltransferase with HDIG domain